MEPPSTDASTGLDIGATTAACTEDLDEQARASWSAPSALFADVDNFKAINDIYGHDAGHSVLRELVAASAATPVSPTPVGGEEFITAMPDTGLEEGLPGGQPAALSALRPSCSASGDMQLKVTASAGIANAYGVVLHHGGSASVPIRRRGQAGGCTGGGGCAELKIAGQALEQLNISCMTISIRRRMEDNDTCSDLLMPMGRS